MNKKINSLVSVIIPVFNTPQELLNRAFQSVLDQDVMLELIVVDDGSDQKTKRFLDDYVLTHECVKVIHGENQGVSRARNKGIEVAQGQYIAFLDADDAITKNSLHEALRIIECSKADIVCGGRRDEFPDGTVKEQIQDFNDTKGYRILGQSDIKYLKCCVFDADALSNTGLKPMRYITNGATLYRAHILENVRFDEKIKLSEDRLFNLECFNIANTVAISNQTWYRYIHNSFSASGKSRISAGEELLLTAKRFEGFLGTDDAYFDQCIYQGIIECFMQSIEFALLRPGFKSASKISKKKYIDKLLEDKTYIRAFKNVQEKNIKQKIFCRLAKAKCSYGVYYLMLAAKKLL